MKYLLCLLVAVPIIAAPVAHTVSKPGPIGLGLIVGSPTGFSFKYDMNQRNGIDAALAYSFTYGGSFHIHADYLWHKRDLFRIDKEPMDLFYGIGGRLLTAAERRDNRLTEVRFGPRVPVGLSHQFWDPPIDVFVELALIVDIIPGTYLDANAGIGARFNF